MSRSEQRPRSAPSGLRRSALPTLPAGARLRLAGQGSFIRMTLRTGKNAQTAHLDHDRAHTCSPSAKAPAPKSARFTCTGFPRCPRPVRHGCDGGDHALADDDAPVGITINSFNSVSLDPPMVLFCLDARSRYLSGIPQCRVVSRFMSSAADQRDWSVRFAGIGDRWDGVGSGVPGRPAPRLSRAAWRVFECTLSRRCMRAATTRSWSEQVVRLSSGGDRRPLAFHLGRYTAVEDV